MNKQQLDKIRKRTKKIPEHSGQVTDDLIVVLDYVEELEEMLGLSSGACYTAAKVYGVIYHKQKEKIEKLEAALKDFASEHCCQTPGCNIDDPKCSAMIARSVLEEII